MPTDVALILIITGAVMGWLLTYVLGAEEGDPVIVVLGAIGALAGYWAYQQLDLEQLEVTLAGLMPLGRLVVPGGVGAALLVTVVHALRG